VDLTCASDAPIGYSSNSQIARVLTESWLARTMYCPACQSDKLSATQANTPSVDFTCPSCSLDYQLKSTKSPIKNRVVDSGYDAMIRAIRNDRTPNLFLLQYSPAWLVANLYLIPSFFLIESAIEKRKPLSTTARRAGWVGCNIILTNIPEDGRIAVVEDGVAKKRSEVRDRFARIRPFAELPVSLRGWTLDVLNVVRKLRKTEFSLAEIYEFDGSLARAHPQNNNVRPKIRQQLQVLRDLGYLQFEDDRGRYRVLR
jgi:type II restriction enzyme